MILLLLIVFESPLDTSAWVPFKARIGLGLLLFLFGKAANDFIQTPLQRETCGSLRRAPLARAGWLSSY